MIVTVDDADTYLSDGGQAFDPTKPSVIFVHGAGMDHTIWGQQTRFTAHRGFNTLAVDLPGHFRSAGLPPKSIESYADWLNRLIEAAGAAPAILVGHSMGALIVLEAAARRPDLCRGLVLAGVSARMRVHPDLIAAAEENRILAPELMTAWGHGPAAHRGGNIASGVWLVGGALRLLERAAPGLIANDLKACGAYEGAPEAAAKVNVPVLILAGAFDKMTPVKAAGPIVDALDDRRLHLVENSGHMMMLEAQQETREALLTFFQSLTAEA
ncbi:MAG: alpha/beta hydrolase [Alphaproteobacteria bacterium]|nr:alpha/beta hydrolase [Alphaproteobacteria bacterium]